MNGLACPDMLAFVRMMESVDGFLSSFLRKLHCKLPQLNDTLSDRKFFKRILHADSYQSALNLSWLFDSCFLALTYGISFRTI